MPHAPKKAYSVHELRAIYGKFVGGKSIPVTRTVFFSWLKPIRDKIGKVNGRIYTPGQVEIIFAHLDRPELTEEEMKILKMIP